MENMLPISVNNTPTLHCNLLIIRCAKENKVFYENLSCNTIKKLALEFTAIKTCYGLDRQTPTIDLLDYLKDEGIAGRIEKRRDKFVSKNKDSMVIRHAEMLKYSKGRRMRIRTIYRDRGLRKTGWKSTLHLHKEHIFFSNDPNSSPQEDDDKIISILQRNIAFQEGFITNQIPRTRNHMCKVQMPTWT